MILRFLTLLMAGALAVACSSRINHPIELRESARVPSPSGWCEAYVVELGTEPNGLTTQVLLSFDGGQGGAGAVSAPGKNLGLTLRWLDSTTLEVQHPKTVRLEYGASGDVIQFFRHKVKVVLGAV